MIPFRFGIARFMIVTAGVAAGLTTMRQSIPVGCLVLAATLLVAFREVLLACLQALWIPIAKLVIRLHQRKIGAVGVLCLTFLIAAAPVFSLLRPGRLPALAPARRPRAALHLPSLQRRHSVCIQLAELAAHGSNLFEPHNTHVVPAWRVVTWALVRTAGTLPRLPSVLAVASYSILIAVMLLTGRLVARESGRAALGLAAMALVGTTSLMLAPAIWYSAGQPLWAGFGILTALVRTVLPAVREASAPGAGRDRGCDRRVALDDRPCGRPGHSRLSLGRQTPAMPPRRRPSARRVGASRRNRLRPGRPSYRQQDHVPWSRGFRRDQSRAGSLAYVPGHS